MDVIGTLFNWLSPRPPDDPSSVAEREADLRARLERLAREVEVMTRDERSNERFQ